MNNRTKTIYNTSIYSPEWTEIDDYNHRRLYAILGFRTLGDFLGMRVYDFLNMNKNDSGYAGNTILDLYNFVNPNNEIDEAIYYDAIEQPINTRRWIAERGSAENITIEEIIFDPLMNKEALNNIFNSNCRAFYKSSEYSIRQYKYAYLRDVPKNKRVPHIAHTTLFSPDLMTSLHGFRSLQQNGRKGTIRCARIWLRHLRIKRCGGNAVSDTNGIL